MRDHKYRSNPTVINKRSLLPLLCACIAMVALGTYSAQGQSQELQPSSPVSLSKGTPERWAQSGWWPTKGTSKHSEYAGTAACGQCHAEIVASQKTTPMFQAASLPSQAEILGSHPELHFSDDKYDYLLRHDAKQTVQSVKTKDAPVATPKISMPVSWAFGVGEVAQTYIFRQKDAFLESRLSYYTSLQALDITTGHDAVAPQTMEQTIGDVVPTEVMRRCFGCHSTASTVEGVFDPEHATLGVTCEACHGPGLQHVTAMTSPGAAKAETVILNPKRMSPVESVDFCGACHRTSVDVAVYVQRELGVAAVRFQPYRLERSLCWGVQGDPRITCVACHDPHQPLVRGTAVYDRNCLQCHASTASEKKPADAAPACPVGTKDCASCHMPKVEVSATHATFTDHLIQVVRPGSGFRQ
jgi:hypothetical protein